MVNEEKNNSWNQSILSLVWVFRCITSSVDPARVAFDIAVPANVRGSHSACLAFRAGENFATSGESLNGNEPR